MINWIKAWYYTIITLCNPKLMKAIRKAQEEYERGEATEWTHGMK